MTDLVPSLVPLDKGLNLQTAKVVAPVGSLLDCFNYEQVDFQGQKRVDGFARFDGRLLSTIDEYYVITMVDTPVLATLRLVGTSEGLLGVVIDVTDSDITIGIINYNLIPATDDLLYYYDEGAAFEIGAIAQVSTGMDFANDAATHYTNLLAYNAILRASVEELPGRVIGLHWFRDKLYAVADVLTINLYPQGSAFLHPNDTVELSTGVRAKVLDVDTISGAATSNWIAYLAPANPADSMDAAPWFDTDNTITNVDDVGTFFITNLWTPELAAIDEKASFFVARPEAESITINGGDTRGWEFIDHGWSVNFTDGISLYGSLPSLNQNITGLGIQGPTTIAGTNGKPLVLSQQADITNDIDQVSGWKSSQTPTTYALETDNFDAIDGDTIYADAYISWSGTTTEVVGFADPLIAYPATNTIVVEV